MFVALDCSVPGCCFAGDVADVEAHGVETLGKVGADEGAETEFELFVVEYCRCVEMAE